ncbi:hypothetical protein [Parablautia muri]|uniref:Lipoprotein n=1 Tax=Parablautia muri TaxID=2320879 RepID=A0A9X5GQW7_9FIRM|nr:hypothetical protein [Parablautia muri]NBJ91556.1 hypothetical protein [Parablautia muri]
MKRGFPIFKKMIISVLTFSVMLVFSACGGEAKEEGGTFLSLINDGTIQSNIEESFEESYYDKDELEQAILEQVDDYNNQAGAESITVKKVEVKDGVALAQLIYAGAQDYAAFNQALFFTGKSGEAESAGYDLNVVLSSVKDSQDTMGKADILALGDEKLLVTDISDAIKLDGKALYISDNVTVSSGGKTVRRTEDGNKIIYVVYK